MVVLLLGLAVSHVVGLAIYSLDRQDVIKTTEAMDAASRIWGVVHLLETLPPSARKDIVRGSNSRSFHVALDDRPMAVGVDANGQLLDNVSRFFATQFPGWAADRIVLGYSHDVAEPATGASPAGRIGGISGRHADFLYVSLRMDDGRWLNFSAAIPVPAEPLPGLAGAYILSVALVIGAVTLWLIARVTAPLKTFGAAAERIGKNIRIPPLSESGPTEVARASRALNDMQQRLRRLIENRMQMLAAVSHDLRTPLTLLRLRGELMTDEEERAKLLATLDEMDAMVVSVLNYTKETVEDEPSRNVDVSALLGSICDDMTDTGAAVEYEAPERILLNCRRSALRRALTNLIDNAVKYGGVARVSLRETDETVDIAIDDDGPGIPEDELERVFVPFHRSKQGGAADNGGIGLGMSIAQSIVDRHGGTIDVANRPEGGLRVAISLPK